MKETKGIPAQRTLKVLGLMGSSSGALGLAGGQAKGLERENKGEKSSFSEFEWIQQQKTAALLKVSIATGATIAGATVEDLMICDQFAVKIGEIFQSKYRWECVYVCVWIWVCICVCIYIYMCVYVCVCNLY